MDKIKAIKKNRLDLSNYLIHFLRNANNKNSFDILKKIIRDGFLISSWAERGAKKTVFGKKPAVCFTEMPLFAYIDYVKKRDNVEKINNYAIVLPKNKMFNLGARNVIYGTTDELAEKKDKDGFYYLDNFPEKELYRYMLTKIDKTNDWSHEREWRWCNHQNLSKTDNLPIWNINKLASYSDSDCNFNYDPILIILNTCRELNEIIQILKEQQKKKEFNSQNIKNTKIIVLEDLNNYNKSSRDIFTFGFVNDANLYHSINTKN